MNRERLIWSPPNDQEVLGVGNSPFDVTILGPRQGIQGSTSQPLWKANGQLVFLQPIDQSTLPINFHDYLVDGELLRYGPGRQDFGVGEIQDDGKMLRLTGNSWKAIEVNYLITPNTVLEFDFVAVAGGELHSIGFESNLRADTFPPPMLKLFGSQTIGEHFRRVIGYPGLGRLHRFQIPVGDVYSHQRWRYLVFANDDDRNANGISQFSNVKLVERPTNATEIATRNYFISQHVHAGGPGEQYPGVVAARVRLDSAEVNLLDKLFRWHRHAPLEVNLMLAVDPVALDGWHRNNTSGHFHAHFHEAVCIGGQIDLDPFHFQHDGGASGEWTEVFKRMNPKLTASDKSPQAVSLTPSGLSMLASPELSWASRPLTKDLPILVSLPLDWDSASFVDYLHIRVDDERLQSSRFQPGRNELISRFDELDEITRLPASNTSEQANSPRWLFLRLNRTSGMPVFHWERTKASLGFVFQPGAWELGISDRISGARGSLRCYPNVKVGDDESEDGKVLTLALERRRNDDGDFVQLKVSFIGEENTPTQGDLPATLVGIITLNPDSIEIDDPRPLLDRLGSDISQTISDLEALPNGTTPSFRLAVSRVSAALRHYTDRIKVLYKKDVNTPTQGDLPATLVGIITLNPDSIEIDDPRPLLKRDEPEIRQAIRDLEALPNGTTPSFRLAVSRISAALRRYTSRLNYGYDLSAEITEKLGCDRIALGYQPLDVAELLREIHGVPLPTRNDFEVTAEDWVHPSVLWGFLKLEDGWAELPFLNLTDQIYTDILKTPPPPAIPFVSGAAVFSNDPIGGVPPENEHLWSLSLTDAASVTGTLTFMPDPPAGTEHLQTAEIQWNRPTMTVEGLAWLGTTPPRREDGLPDLDNWISGLQPLVLQTLEEHTNTPAPFQFELNHLLVTPRTQSGERLGSWTLSIGMNDDPTLIPPARLKEDGVLSIVPAGSAGAMSWLLAAGPFAETLLVGADKKLDPLGESPFQRDDLPPLVWRRHPSLPVIQSLPLTQHSGSTSHPASSRELMPLQVRLEEYSLIRTVFIDKKEDTPKGRPLWLPTRIRFGVVSESVGTVLLAATSYPTLLVEESESANFNESLATYTSLSGVFLSLPGWTWQPQPSIGVAWQDLWPESSRVSDDGLRVQMRAGVPVLDQTVALISHDATKSSSSSPENGELALAIPSRNRDTIPGREQYKVLWRDLNEKSRFAECAAEFMLKSNSSGDAKELRIENLVEPLTWHVSATGTSSYPGRVEFNDSTDQPMMMLEGIDALQGISGSFKHDGNSSLVFTDDGPWQILAGSLQSPLESQVIAGHATSVLRDQRGWSRGFATQPDSASDLISRPMISHRAGDKLYHLQSLHRSLELNAGRAAANNNVTWQLSFTDLPIDETGSFHGPELRSKLAEDINDPASSAADRAPLTGYKFELTSTSLDKSAPLMLADVFPFFPLRLQSVNILGNTVTEVSVVGRLQLPMFAETIDLAHKEMDCWSNAVTVTFKRNDSQGVLRLTSIAGANGERLDELPRKKQTDHERFRRASIPAEIQWPLVYDGGSPKQSKQSKPMLVVMPPGYQTSLSMHFSDELPTTVGDQSTMTEALHSALADRNIIVPHGTMVTLDANIGWVFRDGGGTNEFQMRLDSIGLSVFANPEQAEDSIEYSETEVGISVITLRNVLLTFSFQDVVWTRSLNTKTGAITLDASKEELLIVPEQRSTSQSPIVTGHVESVRLRLQKPNTEPGGEKAFKYSHQVFMAFTGLWGQVSRPQVEFLANCPLIDGVEIDGNLDKLIKSSSLRNPSTGGSSRWEFDVPDHGSFKEDLARGVIEYQWKNLKPIVGDNNSSTDGQSPEALPGFHVSGSVESDASEQTEVANGFAMMTFAVSGRVGKEPLFTPHAGFVEALLPCKWGNELQGNEEAAERTLVPETLYKSSSGDVYVNVTWALDIKAASESELWKVDVLFNGLLEMTNLVSWPVLDIDDEENEFTLPTLDAETERYHHVQRMLLNQHRLPEELITGGQDNVLFGLRDDKVWRPVAVVEHQICRIKKLDGALELTESRCFCLSQEIRIGTPAAFKSYLTDLKSHSTVDPRRDNRLQPVPDSAMGYQSRAMLEDLLADPLIAGTETEQVLIVEGSVHAVIGKEPRTSADTVSYGIVQVLPRSSQQAQLLDIADYQSDFDGTNTPLDESPWTLLSLPFLGRLQNQSLDDPTNATSSKLHADPILQLEGSGSGSRLLLNFTSLGSGVPITVRTSELERSKHRDWLRVDPNTVLEGIIRLQSKHRSDNDAVLGGVMFSGLNNEVSRVLREQTLTLVMDPTRKHFPPKRRDGLEVVLRDSPDSYSWNPNARWLMQGVASFRSNNGSDERAYGVNSIHVSLAMESLLDAVQQTTRVALPNEQRSFTCHPAVTLLPVMPGQGEAVDLQPFGFAVSPCIALRQKRLSVEGDDGGNPIIMTFAELLCLSADGSRLEVVLTRTWKPEATPSEEDLETWGIASHARLAIDSPVAIIRTRHLLKSSEPGQAVLNFRFRPLPKIYQTPKLTGQSTAQSAPPSLRHAAEPQLRVFSPLLLHPVERIGPQPGFVQPMYLRSRPPVSLNALLSPDDPSQTADDAVWPSGLSALHVDVRTTRGGINPVGLLAISDSGTPDQQIHARIWWNSDRIDVQYRVNEDELTRRLPKLFRTSALGGFLSSMAKPIVPPLHHRDLSSAETTYSSLDAYWQSWLNGRYRYFIQGARPGAPLLIHHRLVMSEADQTVESGATAIQYRMTRPMHLPPNMPGDVIGALQTVGTSFALHDPPRRLLSVPDWPAIFTSAGTTDGALAASPGSSHHEDCTGTASTSLDPHSQIVAVLPSPERVLSLVVDTIDSTTWKLVVTMHSPAEAVTFLVTHDPQAGSVLLETQGQSVSLTITLRDWHSLLTKVKLESLPSKQELLSRLDEAYEDSNKYACDSLIAVTINALRGLLQHIAAETTNQTLCDQINDLIPRINEAMEEPSASETAEALQELIAELESVRDLAASDPLASQVSQLTTLLANPGSSNLDRSRPWRQSANPLVAIQRGKPSWLASLEFANQHIVVFRCDRERSVVFAQGPALLDVTTGSKDSFFVRTREAVGIEIQLNSAVVTEASVMGSPENAIIADIRLHGLESSDFDFQDVRLVSLVDGRVFPAILKSDGDNPNRIPLIFDQSPNGNNASIRDQLNRWMRLAPTGAPLALQIVVGLNEAGQSKLGLEIKGFRQQLNLPLRLHSSVARHSPHEPRFQLFEDPEYNRSLATAPAKSATPVPFELVDGGTKQPFGLTIVADRVEYTNTERIMLSWYVDTALFRLDVLPDQFPDTSISGLKLEDVERFFTSVGYPTPKALKDLTQVGSLRRWTVTDSNNNHKLEIRVGQDAVIVHGIPFAQPDGKMKIQVLRPSGAAIDLFNDSGPAWKPDQIREIDLAARKVVDKATMHSLGDTRIDSGDALNIEVSIELRSRRGSPLTKSYFATVRLNVVENSTLPPPSAAYALLHSRGNEPNDLLPGQGGVSVPRFAWSPLPLRVEMVNPDDLKGSIVRRRAVFQWSHTIRKGADAAYALQKCTALGETHIPVLDGHALMP